MTIDSSSTGTHTVKDDGTLAARRTMSLPMSLKAFQPSLLIAGTLRYATWKVAFVTAVLGTMVYYIPTMFALAPGNLHWPGFMLTYDQRVALFPSFIEGYRRFWHGGLLGIDFFTDDGASVFSYRPNLSPFYPPYLLAYLVANCSNLQTGMLAYLAVNIAHQFAGLFFTVILARRYLGLPAPAAVLAASIFGLGWYAANYVNQATFYYQMMLLPVVACGLCWLMMTRSWLASIWMTPVLVTLFLSNYAPMMLADLLCAIVLTGLAYAIWVDGSAPRAPSALLKPAACIILAGLSCLPYYYAQLNFSRVMSPLYDVIALAHDLTLSPYDLLNAFSQSLDLKRTHYEAILVWGTIPTFVAFLGLQTFMSVGATIPRRMSVLVATCTLVYLIILLPGFGTNLLPVADIFFYLAPVLGKMHIYQRYLIFADLFFALAIAGAAVVILRFASCRSRIIAAWLATGLCLGTMIVFVAAPLPAPTASDSFLMELFLLAIAAFVMALASERSALIILACLCAAMGLNAGYFIPLAVNRPVQALEEPSPIGPEMTSISGFLKAQLGNKAIVKLVDASPTIMTYFNRNLGWMIGSNVPVDSFQGYPPHLAVMQSYNQIWGNWAKFDVAWMKQAGVDFVSWKDGQDAVLNGLREGGFKVGPVMDLPGGNHLGRLTVETLGIPPVLDISATNEASWPKPLLSEGWRVERGRFRRIGDAVDQFGLAAPMTVGESYDIAFDAESPGGQLTVALASQVVGRISVKGAAHFSGHVTATSIGDLYILPSPDFQGTIGEIKVLPVLKPELPVVVDNGILRFAAESGTASGFKTDYTQRIRLVTESATGGVLTYLFWPNPYMVPYLDGRRVGWRDANARPLTLQIPPGRHRIDINFRSPAGIVFEVAQLVLVLMILGAAGVEIFRPIIRRQRSRLVALKAR